MSNQKLYALQIIANKIEDNYKNKPEITSLTKEMYELFYSKKEIAYKLF
jgi:hypothetical protein